MAWSPGNTKMYHIDSGPRKLWSFSFDDGSSCFTKQAGVLVDFHGKGVVIPDDMCTDSEGRLWRAKFFGATIVLVGPSHGRDVDQDRVPSPLHEVVLHRVSRIRVDVCHDRLCGGWGGGAEYTLSGTVLVVKEVPTGVRGFSLDPSSMRQCGEEGERVVAGQ